MREIEPLRVPPVTLYHSVRLDKNERLIIKKDFVGGIIVKSQKLNDLSTNFFQIFRSAINTLTTMKPNSLI